MNFTKLLTSCKEKRQGCRTKHSTWARQTNMEEVENGVKRTLAKPMNNKDSNENKWKEKAALHEIQIKNQWE